jgi:parvulin-like peptidyl-prolyl isomerase
VKINEEVSPDEMIEYYRAHLADYEFPTQARWEELAVRKDRFKDPADAYAELAKMGNEVWQRRAGQPVAESAPSGATTYFSASLQNTAKPLKGAAFADVATAKSDGFTSKNGGLHDWTTKGALQCKAIDEALFTLQVGQLSPIIDSGPMFHIVRVLERKEAGREAYTDVQADIRDKLKDERMQVEVEKYLARLRSEARIWTVFTGHVSADTLMGRKPDQSQRK